MDDFIRGENGVESALKLRREMTELLKRGGFRLRKWCSNCPEVLEGVPAEDLATQSSRSFDPEEAIKTLGISWEPSTDQFRFSINVSMKEGPITKRKILSEIARLYDPLGLIAPIVVRAKILMQQLWMLSLSWDEEVPTEILTKWTTFTNELSYLTSFRIDRYAFEEGDVQLHCFADASDVANGACMYVRTIGNGGAKVELLTSKSRVAPLKRRSIPRLELCAAQIAASLATKVRISLNIVPASTWFWSDSTVVLHWLRSPPQTWKTFVSNRVADIQILTHGSRWQHVPGIENPADLVSRGMEVQKFITSKLWRHGPDWLQEGEDLWPKQVHSLEVPADECEERKITSLVLQTPPPPPNPLITRFSLYHRMIRTVAYCLRFIKNARKGERNSTVFLSDDEVKQSQITIVKMVQTECFQKELSALRKGQSVTNQSTLKLLNPFLDSSGIIRVGGRLRLLEEPYSTKHPILLAGFHHFTKLLLTSYHRKLLHGGILHTLAVVRDEFWPTNGRRAIRSVIYNCFRCSRTNPRLINQPVGQIPPARITPSRPFASTGIDYCGPVYVKSKPRKAASIKAYIALFVCFSTKAVHIELVGDLSTSSFISALRRFIARRGLPEHIYSDNATNFVGAKHELHDLYRMLHNHTENARIATCLATNGIKWHMIPPRAPNFGGLWEAAVKVAKRHLLRQIGTSSLLHEDLETVLVQIEGCMNSRPLVALSDDPNDLQALTPGHFLVGTSLQALPEIDLREISINRLNRYQLAQQKVQHFWHRWKTEYLRELQRQATINPQKVELKVGQIVILQDQQLPPIRWPLARVVELHPGQDDVVRVATVRTATGVFKRPTSKLCLLPSAMEADNIEYNAN